MFEKKLFLCYNFINAGIAQLVEQLTCNQQVAGSSPIASSNPKKESPIFFGYFLYLR